MGACCTNNQDLPTGQTPNMMKKGKAPRGQVDTAVEVKPVLKDLNPPSSWGMDDKIESFERSLPFNRIHVSTFISLIEQVEVDGCVTLQSLSTVLTTQAWQDLKSD